MARNGGIIAPEKRDPPFPNRKKQDCGSDVQLILIYISYI